MKALLCGITLFAISGQAQVDVPKMPPISLPPINLPKLPPISIPGPSQPAPPTQTQTQTTTTTQTQTSPWKTSQPSAIEAQAPTSARNAGTSNLPVDGDMLGRLAAIDELYVQALKPQPEDSIIDADDPYAKAWPEYFGPEGKRRKRFEKARKLAEEMRQEVYHDYQIRREQRLADAKVEADIKREDMKVKFEEQQMALIRQIAASFKDDKDVEITVDSNGNTTIKKGRVPAPPQNIFR